MFVAAVRTVPPDEARAAAARRVAARAGLPDRQLRRRLLPLLEHFLEPLDIDLQLADFQTLLDVEGQLRLDGLADVAPQTLLLRLLVATAKLRFPARPLRV